MCWALIVPNQMLARTGRTQEGKLIPHSLEATADRVYQVVEFDAGTRQDSFPQGNPFAHFMDLQSATELAWWED
jgi:hypothetical protein